MSWAFERYVAGPTTREPVWHGVGLDTEPDARIFLQITDNLWGLVPMLVPRLADRVRPGRAKAAYRALVQQIRADGWRVENYPFLPIADERQPGRPCCSGWRWSTWPPTARCGCCTPRSCAHWGRG